MHAAALPKVLMLYSVPTDFPIFFICFQSAPHLDRQYSVFGKVIKGMEFVDQIKRGQGSNGEVSDPDKIISMTAK